MYPLVVRPWLFALEPELAHKVGMMALAPLEYVAPLRGLVHQLLAPRDPRLQTHAFGLRFPSPIGLAGGFDKNAARPRALGSLGFGFLELGTVTNLPQEPNPSPNLFRLPEDRALINRLGFPNEGAAAVAHRIAACRKGLLAQLPLAVSIGKSRAVDVDPIEPAVADYIASFRLVKPVADMVVVNISSPNTKNLRAMQSAELARTLLSALVLENSTIAPRIPILVKVAPDLGDEDLEKLLSVIEELGIDGVVATNTTVSRFGLRTPDAVVDAMGAGGLSGPPLKARALAVVHRIRQRLGPKPVIVGVGGVETGADARAMLGAGANLIQLYTSFVYRGPMTPHAIAAELLAIAHQEGVKSVSEFVGVPPGV